MEEPGESDSNSWESMSTDSDSESITTKFLDIRSPHFSPKLALMCKNLKPPVPNAESCHSLEQFRRKVPCLTKPKFSPKKKSDHLLKLGGPGCPTPLLPATASQRQPAASTGIAASQRTRKQDFSVPETNPSSSASASGSTEPFYPIPGRKFLPHQMPVFRPRKQQPNVLTLMETLGGPFSALNEARIDGHRVKVWTKNNAGFRGYSLGTLIAFDKHWNLLLRDIDEVFQRKRRIKLFPEFKSSSDQEVLTRERESFKSGKLLSMFSESRKRVPTTIQKGRQTQFLVESPDALDLCRRIGVLSLTLPETELCNLKAKSDEDSTNSKPCNSQLRKKRLVILNEPYLDMNGNRVVAHSQLFEIVERHIRQMLLMGDNVIFIETHPK